MNIADGARESSGRVANKNVTGGRARDSRENTRLHQLAVNIDIQVALVQGYGHREPCLERNVLNRTCECIARRCRRCRIGWVDRDRNIEAVISRVERDVGIPMHIVC